MDKKVIRVQNLVSGYDERIVLDDILFEVVEGEILVILGTSGCGKTTLLKHLMGLMQPYSGEIQLLGHDLLKADEKEMLKMMRQIGVLFQNGALLNSITVAENVAIPLEQHTDLSKELIEDLVRLKLSLVGLERAAHALPSELSGGMRKRAALARAIALDPKVLFADEPAAGLDPVTAAALDRLLLNLRDLLGMTLVVVTHEVGSIRRIADRILFLHEGKAVFYGKLSDALKSDIEPVQKFFNA
ncbi:ABC transporter related protein [Caldithrix abyssi DSM 13497]|uniref:ABC transporter related protein n=1 Tax=Caldithrix abyssi DSM 13497 TaxID=880073 RepID=H1XWC6_CALAY|nr:ATP-binding cassette domain-containing protein [Caldithrix abyssi]APF20809.1 phospholipid/cholesterol/gamma-HCH transport system ATP-binding protein [Caldithrix abyssi DSM 13497]EHO40708.1 ABC transporter related protein [Caldithrix abyssi DSM 13497]